VFVKLIPRLLQRACGEAYTSCEWRLNSQNHNDELTCTSHVRKKASTA